ncbi:hypothetical protein VTK73DRAFT_7969 [Phialemonium thermophilum]|uniref:Cytochrome P450 n=1 Tax=Phialemonium thermophilum TaxID=223376 RepID=A0ABR3WBH0_9PEZI
MGKASAIDHSRVIALNYLDVEYLCVGIFAGVSLLLLFSSISHRSLKPDTPHLNPKGRFELTKTRAKKLFISRSREMLGAWFSANPDKAVRLTTDVGEVTVLPPHLANEIRNDQRLSFAKWTFSAFHAHLPGFEGFREGSRDSDIVRTVLLKDLTKLLTKVTEPLAEETSLALTLELTNEKVCRLITRVTSRVFLGPKLCRDEAWLKVARESAITSMAAAEELRMWPSPLRSIVHWFLPSCRRARAQVREARRIIDPVLAARRRRKQTKGKREGAAGERDGEEGQDGEKEPNDAIEWFDRTAGGNEYDPVTAQMLIAFVAIHTTADLVSQVLTDLAQHPEMIEPLREEVLAELAHGGWRKASLYNMKLMDSAIKESQRMKPILLAFMRRMALEDVRLSDGTLIPKDTVVAVSAHRMWDATLHEAPERWDGRRFLRMRRDEAPAPAETSGSNGSRDTEKPRQPQLQHWAQLVTTSPDHLGFGHGHNACPGRFFAANEIKVMLAHLLLKSRAQDGVPASGGQASMLFMTDGLG